MPTVGMPLMGLIVVQICTIFKAKFWVSNTTSLSQNDFHNHSRLVEKKSLVFFFRDGFHTAQVAAAETRVVWSPNVEFLRNCIEILRVIFIVPFVSRNLLISWLQFTQGPGPTATSSRTPRKRMIDNLVHSKSQSNKPNFYGVFQLTYGGRRGMQAHHYLPL